MIMDRLRSSAGVLSVLDNACFGLVSVCAAFLLVGALVALALDDRGELTIVCCLVTHLATSCVLRVLVSFGASA